MATQQTIIAKRRPGRPPKGIEIHAFNFRMESDLYEWVNSQRGDTPLTTWLNNYLRKEAGL